MTAPQQPAGQVPPQNDRRTPSQPEGQTPSQTVGPYFAYGLVPTQYGFALRSLFGPVLAGPEVQGEPILIIGQVFDGDGQPIEDALVEILHADAQGVYPATPDEVGRTGFRGFGRMGTGSDAHRGFEFRTIKPGATADGQAPHVNVILMMRGLLDHLFTRIYFDDETAANGRDPVLASVPAERRAALLARRVELPGGTTYRFDIRMQGEHETVFFDA
jgi:protocatechuate 3,4-dioxygenase, alpha subunit